MHGRNKNRAGKFDGPLGAGGGFGPYNVRKEVQRIWEV